MASDRLDTSARQRPFGTAAAPGGPPQRLDVRLANAAGFAVLEVLRLLPWPWVFRWLRLSSGLAWRLQRQRRRRSVEWLRRVAARSGAPRDIRAGSRRIFAHAAARWYLSYLLPLRGIDDIEPPVEIEGLERVEGALAGGRGVVLLSTHVGLPRLLRCVLRKTGWPVCHVLGTGIAPPDDTSLRARIERWHARRYGLDRDLVIGSERSSVQAMKRAYDHLRRNGIVNIAGDVGRGGRLVPVTIAGRAFRFGRGGLSLALLAGAPVLPCFTMMRDGRRFRVEIEEPLPLPPPGDRDARIRQLADAYADRIDRYIHRYPCNVLATSGVSIYWAGQPDAGPGSSPP